MPGPYSLMIARFPGNNQEHPESSGYVIGLMEQLHNDDRISKIVPFRISDTPITMCRNRCVKDALARKVDYLLMIDSDMAPDCEFGAPLFWPTAWDFMMDRRAQEEEYLRMSDIGGGKCDHLIPIENPEPATIAAPYCGPPPDECVYIFKWASKENFGQGNPNLKLQMYDREHAASLTGIQEVAALPTGLILYDMRVFRKLPPPWFDYEWADPPFNTVKASTEDVHQTRNASMLGMPQFVAWDCWAAHIKTKYVTKPKGLGITTIRQTFADACIAARDQHKARVFDEVRAAQDACGLT